MFADKTARASEEEGLHHVANGSHVEVYTISDLLADASIEVCSICW